MIDRIRPTKRPEENARGYQQWRSLLFMHWPVPVDMLRPLVPDALELDLFDGQAYVGVVPFVMCGVRPRWAPRRLAFNFLETNVRTYVVHRDRPGVFFLSLEAASRVAVWSARMFWGLPYFYADMEMKDDGGEICYKTVRRRGGHQHQVRYRLGDLLGPSHPGSLEFFFLERYLLFLQRGRSLYCGQVHHAPYPAQRAEVLEVHDELIAAAGLGEPSGLPELVHYASGVDVEIFSLRRAAGSS